MAIGKIGKFTVLATLGAGAHSSILHVRREDDLKEYARKVVSFDDGERVSLGPGSVVRLRAGEHTTWVVHETIRTIYVA